MTRILAVDDEPPILRALGVNLRARRYEVDLASNGEQALDLAARHRPDAVILDLGLPGLSGIDGEVRTEPVAAPLLHHRAGHGLPLRGQPLTRS